MILGIGIDIVQIARFEREGLKPAFFYRLFTPDERAYCLSQARSAQHFAGRFAAKEAAVKALCWLPARPRITQVEVTREPDTGAPAISLIADRSGLAPALPGGVRLYVSLSHSRTQAIAVVIAETEALNGLPGTNGAS